MNEEQLLQLLSAVALVWAVYFTAFSVWSVLGNIVDIINRRKTTLRIKWMAYAATLYMIAKHLQP